MDDFELQSDLSDCLVLLRSGSIIFFDAEGQTYGVAAEGNALVKTRPVSLNSPVLRVISVREAFDRLNQSSQTFYYVPPSIGYTRRQGNSFQVLLLVLILIGMGLLAWKAGWINLGNSATQVITLPQTQGQTQAPQLPALEPPLITSPEAVVLDPSSSKVLYGKDEHRRAPMASTTKIMTALTALAIPGTNLDEKYTVVKQDLSGPDETVMGLKAGEVITFRDLLYGMLLPSGNDAARAIARYAGAKLPGGGDPYLRFIDRMNQQAQDFGLKDSHFTNPHGLDETGHYSSAFDLAIMGKKLLDQPLLAKIVATQNITVAGHNLSNGNYFLGGYRGATGIKTGFTDGAGYCLVASATREGKTIISVVMGGDRNSYLNDPSALADFGFRALLR